MMFEVIDNRRCVCCLWHHRRIYDIINDMLMTMIMIISNAVNDINYMLMTSTMVIVNDVLLSMSC